MLVELVLSEFWPWFGEIDFGKAKKMPDHKSKHNPDKVSRSGRVCLGFSDPTNLKIYLNVL